MVRGRFGETAEFAKITPIPFGGSRRELRHGCSRAVPAKCVAFVAHSGFVSSIWRRLARRHSSAHLVRGCARDIRLCRL